MFGSNLYGVALYGSLVSGFKLLAGAASATSGASGNIDRQPPLAGVIAATSGVTACVDILTQLVGLVAATSGAAGSIDVIKELYALTGQLAAGSSLLGVIAVDTPLTGSAAGTPGASADLNIPAVLIGAVATTSDVSGSLGVFTSLAGVAGATSGAAGIIRAITRPVDFYGSVAAQITKYFQGLADTNRYVARYDNDLRATPTDDLWHSVLVDFGEAVEYELGRPEKFRVVGNLSIRVINAIGEGLAAQLEAADLISNELRTKNVGRISFGVPTIQKVGRVGDNEYINVTCPFLVDKHE